MAGLEVVVRPVVFPNIRPAPTRSVAPEDNPEQGLAVLSGSGGRLIDLSMSENISVSRSRMSETKRRSDEAKVYQQEEDGTINEDNFVVVRVPNKIWMNDDDADRGPVGETIFYYKPIGPDDNVEILRKDIIEMSGGDRGAEE